MKVCPSKPGIIAEVSRVTTAAHVYFTFLELEKRTIFLRN